MNNAEVQLTKLTAEHRELFTRAKTKEADSFLENQAVRKCLNDDEIRRAADTNRIIKARWVLTWKQTAPDEIESAKKEAPRKPRCASFCWVSNTLRCLTAPSRQRLLCKAWLVETSCIFLPLTINGRFMVWI